MATTLAVWKEPTGTPASNFGTPAVRNNRLVTAFDATTNEDVYLEGVMPQAYAGGTLELRARCATDATTGDVDIDVAVEDAGALDLDTDSFDTDNSTDNTSVPGTAGTEFEVAVTLTNADAVAAGDVFRLRFRRDAAADTAAATLHVYAWELREQ